MGVVKGIKNITSHVAEREARKSGSGVRWAKIKGGEAIKVVFLQELDPDSENYSQKNDLMIVAVEHSHPKNFKKKALCTIDDGACYGCERKEADWQSKWGARDRLYANVLVDNGVDDLHVAVLSQGTSGKSIFPNLVEHATEFGTVTDRWFKIKRIGSRLDDTAYTLTALKEHDLNVEDYELIETDKIVNDIPYAEQEAYFLDGESAEEEAPTESRQSSEAPVDSEEW